MLVEPRQARVELEEQLNVALVGDEGGIERSGRTCEESQRPGGGCRFGCRSDHEAGEKQGREHDCRARAAGTEQHGG